MPSCRSRLDDRRPDVKAAGDRFDALDSCRRALRHRLERALVDQRADQRIGIARIADCDRGEQLRSRATSSSAMLSWTISRRSVVQRCPAVPAAENRIARSARSRSALGATIIALLPPSSSSTRPKRRGDARADRPAHRGRSGRRNERDARIVDQCLADLAAALDASGAARRAHRRIAPARGLRKRHHRRGGQRRLLARLPDHRIAAHQRQRGIPRPYRDREIEGGDHRDRAERMPLLDHPVVGPLAGDGQAIKLARQADREVADVDHLLDFAEAFLDDLAGLQRHQPGQRLLGGAQFLAKQPNQFAAARRRNHAPGAGRLRPRARRLRRPAPARFNDRPITAPSIGERLASAPLHSTPSLSSSSRASSAGLTQQLLRPRHRRDARVDGLVALGKAQPDQVPRRLALGEGGQRHDRDPGSLDRALRRNSRRRRLCPMLRSTHRK